MQPTHNSRRILVGEDELEVRAYLEMAVKCLGYSVELAQDGDEVLSCLQASGPPPDAVLLDLMMPNRDGLETLKEIRRSHSSLPVIVVSGAFSTMNVVTAMKNGATEFLCKPVVHEDLQILAGNTTLFIFPLCVLFVFLTLAAQYESWALPFAIILIVPMCILSALAGVLLRRMDNNIFTQIGFVVLVGLACKNAILIV